MILDGEKNCLGSMKNPYKKTMKTVTKDTYLKFMLITLNSCKNNIANYYSFLKECILISVKNLCVICMKRKIMSHT